MREIRDIQLDAVIVHVLVPKNEMLVLSDAPINLSTSEPAVQFITGHILSTHKNENLRIAKFLKTDPDLPSGISADLLKHPSHLVKASQKLATNLYDIMKDDKRISPCDLVVALYHEVGENNSPYLALLKLDPSSAFQNRITRAGGQRVVNLEEINLIFTTERLQKAALIQTIDPKNMYDLLLLDSQAGLYKGGQIAEFFRETFLDCDFAYDSKELTKELRSALLTVENKLLWEGLANDSQKFSKILREVLLSQNFNLQKWYPDLPLSKQAKGIVSEVFESQLHSQVFEIDGDQARRFSQKAAFTGGNGLKIEINADSIDQIEYVYVPSQPMAPAHWDITITTQILERVK